MSHAIDGWLVLVGECCRRYVEAIGDRVIVALPTAAAFLHPNWASLNHRNFSLRSITGAMMAK